MKQKACALYYLLIMLCTSIIHGSTIVQSDRRAWEIASDVYDLSQSIESKLCILIGSLSLECVNTVTTLQIIENKSEIILSTAQSINSALDVILIQEDVYTIQSKVAVITSEMDIINKDLDVIRVNDFGGTWTALEALSVNACNVFESVFDDLLVVNSKIDILIQDNMAQFIATYTKIQELSLDVIETMTKMSLFSQNVNTTFLELDSIVDIFVQNILMIESNVCTLQVDIQNCFLATLTTTNSIVSTVCTIESSVDSIKDTLVIDFNQSFTVLSVLQEKTNSMNSNIDTINELLNTIKIKATILSNS